MKNTWKLGYSCSQYRQIMPKKHCNSNIKMEEKLENISRQLHVHQNKNNFKKWRQKKIKILGHQRFTQQTSPHSPKLKHHCYHTLLLAIPQVITLKYGKPDKKTMNYLPGRCTCTQNIKVTKYIHSHVKKRHD